MVVEQGVVDPEGISPLFLQHLGKGKIGQTTPWVQREDALTAEWTETRSI